MNTKLVCLIALANIILMCNARPSERIVNGQLANNFQFPWHAAITVIRGQNPVRYCSGSIISEWFVLTAANFINNAERALVSMGSIRYSTPLLTVESRNFFIHPFYNPSNLAFDIGILQFPNAIQFNNNIRPIRLPSMSQMSQSFEYAQGQISGFGVESSNSQFMSENLRYSKNVVISNAYCATIYQSSFITASVLCAVGANNTAQGPCFGDTGSALVINENNIWTQIGVAIFYSPQGCESTYPSGYTRVTSALNWINQLTGIPIRP